MEVLEVLESQWRDMRLSVGLSDGSRCILLDKRGEREKFFQELKCAFFFFFFFRVELLNTF